MTNYVLNYRFEDFEEASEFLRMLKKKYPEHVYEMRHGIPYFAFPSKSLAAVDDNSKAIIDELLITDSDYAAIYYIRKEKPENIKRLMVLGRSDLADDHLLGISSAEHENLLDDLFDIDFAKHRVEQQETR